MEIRTPSLSQSTQEKIDRLPFYGTEADRIRYFPLAVDPTGSVELANARPYWYNTEQGWLESYYAPENFAGLTVPGLKVGVSAGWYPVGDGPKMVVSASGGQSFSGVGVFNSWLAPGSGHSWLRGNSGYLTFEDNNKIRAQKAGRYSAFLAMGYPNGSGTGVSSFRAASSAGADINIIQKATTLLASYGQIEEFHMPLLHYNVGQYIYFRADAGAWTLGSGNPSTLMVLEYKGPPLAQ